ncbi:DNA helicase HerA-like ATPase [Paenibacillus cellulosilyticus]|uniref:DNA helicase HerA-like ATPase n=1 Tax=Paenibacillus cellulosilyticus TaxID=375489 RepID=A0A2V2YQM3_9BACL|nr:DUF87 domain-containing protein [Paenibacillus cellulosilyticus]PWV99306.1 DNA helicase HerA-like ATPase [Paenibacillus cellulosilyticus]QKS45071.1 ATP-binding protein [Paenibacillus cellulosilyticus]
MSDIVDLTGGKSTVALNVESELTTSALPISNVPSYEVLQSQLAEASLLVDDIVLKNYLTKLTELDIIPLPDSLKEISDIRLFKITEMVYQNDEYSTYKFASVFNSVQNLNCGVFIIADSNGHKTDFYMGVRALDDKRTTKSLKDTLRNALRGQFPGVKTEDLLDSGAEQVLAGVQSKNIAAVSCVANNKDAEFTDNERFIQGLDKLVLAMQGQRYTAVILAKSTPNEQLAETRRAYENVYTQLSPFANMQLSYGTNTALNISDAFSRGTTTGSSHSTNHSTQTGTSRSSSFTINESETKTNRAAMIAKGAGAALLGVASIVTAPMTGGASIVAAGAIMAGSIGLGAINPKSVTKGTSTSENNTETSSETIGESDTTNESTSDNYTRTKGLTSGTSDNMQLTMQNKTLINTLERIDQQLQRIDECESLGMWECAAYFLSDSQETAEMAAGTYKALMKGEKSGVETSAINFWGRGNAAQLPMLREYITNFIHPVFAYRTESATLPVTASSLVSGNELAIQMGLPRKSVCGFPVIEHADFGKEVVTYNQRNNNNGFTLGNVFTMGSETTTNVRLDRDSMTMHTFVTGSTGSGKSNTVYEILNQLRNVYGIPFLVVEPAKGEYKNMFGQFADVSVYGTNPKKSDLLRINPFRFPPDIHVLEHLDRLVELFNVCWSMYAAMPAILKEAMEQAYIAAGWNLSTSENPKGNVYPNFTDLLEQIENVINESQYSADSKGDYAGALCTRVRSLTNGLNGLIFTSDDLTDAELFDRNVIVDLSRVGAIDTKSLIMGLLVMKLNEYRMTSGQTNSPLKHITVLEEAHVLLKRTSTEQSAESANLLGKSVELLANSIAEMRTYGEGFIIADQSPGLLDMSVIRNTNTKIILRLPERSDRELVGFAANLNEEQIGELSKLERGVAAIYQNDWVEPVLVKVNKCNIGEKQYDSNAPYMAADVQKLWTQLISLLIQGRVRERLDFSTTEIERHLAALRLSSQNREFVEELIAEYTSEGRLSLWSDTEFIKLSRRITGLLGVRAQVENIVSTSVSNEELTDKLAALVNRFLSNVSEEVILTLSQCLMKDISVQQEESEVRERIYMQWIDYVKERAVGKVGAKR